MLTDSEFKDFIEDSNKIINGDIEWQEDEDHSPSVEFRAQLHSNDGHTSYVKGSYNPLIPALTYAIIHSRVKRIYRPEDITAPVTDPVEVWRQFCKEASIRHNGVMQNPPLGQGDPFLV